jgi:hypothetical protein
MTPRQEGLPAASLLLLAAALLLFGFGGGLVGYMAGERQGEERANVIAGMLADRWEALRGDAANRFDDAIASAAGTLENSAADLKAEVSMYHGCGGLCTVIAHQFGEELLHARDAIRKTEPPTLASWGDVLRQSGLAVEAGTGAPAAPETGVRLASGYSGSTIIVAVALLCVTDAACFAFACFTLLKLRAQE